MVDINNKIIYEEKKQGNYSEKKTNVAINYINSFLRKLNSLTVSENDSKRTLNELETFICIYEFVTKHNYKDKCKLSQDVIGAINYDCFVCISFSKLIKILCDECHIPCFIKYSVTKDGYLHANNEVLIKDKNGKKHLLHVDATIDCLNYEDVYCSRDSNIPRINALLLVEEDINKYRNTIEYQSSTNSIYTNLVNGLTPDKLFEITDIDVFCISVCNYSYEEIMIDKIEEFNNSLIDLAQFFNVNYHGNDIEKLKNSYGEIQKQYQEASSPIDFNEMIEALENAQLASLRYDFPNSDKLEELAKLITLKKIQTSTEFQLKNYQNDQGKSFMFTLVNNNLNRNI